MKILNHKQIEQKITRLAYQITENNFDREQIILAGINNNGMRFAGLLQAALDRIGRLEVTEAQISLNPADPVSEDIRISIPADELNGRSIIVVDDVANTGRTLYYAFRPLLEVIPELVECAVLIDRKHKSFPIKVDYVGLSLATTLKENIVVELEEEMAVYLR